MSSARYAEVVAYHGRANDACRSLSWCSSAQTPHRGIVKLTKGSSIDPQDTGLQPVANPP